MLVWWHCVVARGGGQVCICCHFGGRPVLLRCRPGATGQDELVSQVRQTRVPLDWVEDMSWHRRMYRQSMFRWAPEDPMALALQWTKGRLVYSTPKDFAVLDQQLLALRGFAGQIDDAMAPKLREARIRSTRNNWLAGLDLIGLSELEVDILDFHAPGLVTPNREVKRALRGIPVPNPFSQVWELRQMRSMYTAAEHLLEDALCDLAVELAPRLGWDFLGQLMTRPTPGRNLEWIVDEQRDARGQPGDPRREPEHRY